MTAYTLLYHREVVSRDIVRIPRNMRKRIRGAIERRLAAEPSLYGQPLRRSLRGYRKLRVGDDRVIYRIKERSVVILVIGHRSDVYGRARERPGNW